MKFSVCLYRAYQLRNAGDKLIIRCSLLHHSRGWSSSTAAFAAARKHSGGDASPFRGELVATNLELIRCQTQPRPALLLLFAWLEARRKHLDEYFRFYLNNGFDILYVNTRAKDLLFPPLGSQVVARNVMKFISSSPYDDIMLHSMSVGGYQWGECLRALEDNPKEFGHIGQKLRAQVFDSVVDVAGIPRGLPRALSRNPLVHVFGEVGLRLYLLLAYPFATRYYNASSDAFRNRPNGAPVCFFNSKGDTIGNLDRDNDVIAMWRKKGMDVRLTTFDDSKHVQHHGMYPDRYREELVSLINRTIPRLAASNNHPKKQQQHKQQEPIEACNREPIAASVSARSNH